MILGGLQKLTLIDFPGRLACTVFLSGCNFRCPWCYSKELVLPQNIEVQPKISEKQFFDFLETRQDLLSGVVVCGGEPTTQEDLPQFVEKIKKMNFLVKLDTNGSDPRALQELFKDRLLDYVAMDVKQFQKYNEATGVKTDLAKIKESVELIKNSGVDYEFRTTVVPTIHAKEDIIEIAKWLSPAKRYYLQNFRSEKTVNPSFENQKPYSNEDLLDIQKAIAPLFEICEIR
ncbi:MAG: anaerobic ribonucleoside-triphosphate reductase activating protein [Candidatus Nealsonbacteria bacterium RIFCSPHIGHO2_01_FULL_43_31]|uniref:Anaerobic ribonucleoside-triphosphate reductase activating protein n=2 Tax=Candidatus Nealsoniibacteriota TaxID=1817911 RepID=A0A1G2E670_9BACT|nr:MAG: Anaerobic ribonucleoside-triphosphate reductase activating protein [Parcubacteria group bacterium GW2011_GWB1_43_6]OGZ20682.1 MAG: anaerobic ribonucleoside-triphosphate reductase activating protein [Candidatus Nealsonbacteria bacterium RIFCSPHIGHO2_01_FULL_43_31]OGZ21364.1 MAG: anaerobic ribonucleoside-triphosphate reductase activating protein [Candidatus Nealsonbacteria bacterium RIFCSPHIGHO2_02_FULL_43_13]OGZ25577.1 MAG: anaerobic ribonucleoside-triphosphate reductase activating protei